MRTEKNCLPVSSQPIPALASHWYAALLSIIMVPARIARIYSAEYRGLGSADVIEGGPAAPPLRLPQITPNRDNLLKSPQIPFYQDLIGANRMIIALATARPAC
jgi:hypothetical protein